LQKIKGSLVIAYKTDSLLGHAEKLISADFLTNQGWNGALDFI